MPTPTRGQGLSPWRGGKGPPFFLGESRGAARLTCPDAVQTSGSWPERKWKWGALGRAHPCVGLNARPQESDAQGLTPGAVHVTLFGNRLRRCDQPQGPGMRASWVWRRSRFRWRRWRRPRRTRDTHGEVPRGDGGRGRSDVLTSQGPGGSGALPETGRGGKGSPRASCPPALPTSRFQTPASGQ